MKIGNYEIYAVETGRFGLDGGAMFGIVPWVFWSKTNPPDERNRIELAARALLIIGNGRKILVDDGNGDKMNERFRDIYKIDNSKFNIISSLKKVNLSPDDITDVILTHLHFDHAGGSTMRKDGRLIPTFPNARYYVQKKHWGWAQQPTDKDRGSFVPDDFLPLKAEGVLEIVDGEFEIFPGIGLLICNGHTTAIQLPKISDGKTTLLYCCDLIPTFSHLPYPYVMGYDLRPLVTIEEKKKILPRAYEEKWILFSEHDPFTEAVTIKSSEKGFMIDQKIFID